MKCLVKPKWSILKPEINLGFYSYCFRISYFYPMSTTEKADYIQKIDLALNEIRPHLAVDGGNIEVVDVTEDFKVLVKWLGNCQACSMSAMTMKAGIEHTIKQKFPEIISVEAVN